MVQVHVGRVRVVVLPVVVVTCRRDVGSWWWLVEEVVGYVSDTFVGRFGRRVVVQVVVVVKV